jgi:uncharacterized membrane protein YphA (DoxX/SURF4 family)
MSCVSFRYQVAQGHRIELIQEPNDAGKNEKPCDDLSRRHEGPARLGGADNQHRGGDRTLKAKLIGYWATTAVVAFVLLAGGTAELAHQRDTVEGVVHLGYPVYFTTILGFWKVLGGIALLAPGLPRLKEWAYAGTFFDLTGAVASHAACGDNVGHILAPLIFAVVTLASWALRPPSRIFGVLFPGQTPA